MRFVPALVGLLAALAGTAAAATCPGAGAVAVWIDNRSADAAVVLRLDGDLAAAADTCSDAPGTSTRTTYRDETLTCAGTGLTRCGAIDRLRPGAWWHRVRLQVNGSDPQEQAQALVVLAPPANDRPVANALVWTVYPRTVAVTRSGGPAFREALRDAVDWTAAHPDGWVLVDVQTDEVIDLGTGATTCPADCETPDAQAGVCITGERLVIDGLDGAGRRAVVSATGNHPVLGVSARDLVLRGLDVRGQDAAGAALIVGSGAGRIRLEDLRITAPAGGDAVVVGCGAGLDGDGDEIVLERCELRDGRGRGLDVGGGARARIGRSCVHDTTQGGLRVTGGATLVAEENLVQRTLGSATAAGIAASGEGSGARTQLVTRGNLVRWTGDRGLAVDDHAAAELRDDHVSRSGDAGARVLGAHPGPPPRVHVAGVALACNGVPELADGAPAGAGLAVGFAAAAPCAGCDVGVATCACAAPIVTLGDGTPEGACAFAWNGSVPDGPPVNLVLGVPGAALDATGMQWETCGPADGCSAGVVRGTSIGLAVGASVAVEPIVPSPRAATPTLRAVAPARPRKGEIVRVYGTGFNAVDGNDIGASCRDAAAMPADGCDAADPGLAAANRGTNGNRLRLVRGADSTTLDVVAATPTMLAFRMPVDCHSTARVQLRTGPDSALDAEIALCDPDGCDGRPAGWPCVDDDRPCSLDVCDGAGSCHVPAPAGTVCRDAVQACDVADVCSGTSLACPDVMLPAGSECRAARGACDAAEQCSGTSPGCPPDEPAAAGVVCRGPVGPCDAADRCDGETRDCPADAKRTGECRAAAGGCDVAEACDGQHDGCPDDDLADAGVVCRSVAGRCDVLETCDGVSAACPADAYVAAGTPCRVAADACDLPEACPGDAPACPDDRVAGGFEGVSCQTRQLEAAVAASCEPTSRRLAVVYRRFTRAHARAQALCGGRRVGAAKRQLGRAATALARFRRLAAGERCLQASSGAWTTLAARGEERLAQLRRALPDLCGRRGD